MTDSQRNAGDAADDMADYLQTFLDETEEQLDDLVETMLALENDSTSKEDLNEAFRLIHSIKGSAGMMGFDSITVLTHHLENRFERFRSAAETLDERTMSLVLRCIDFLRQCNNRLRSGQPLGSSVELLDEVKLLEEQAESSGRGDAPQVPDPPGVAADDAASVPSSASTADRDGGDAAVRMLVRFRAGLPLADLKAQLIASRLSRLGDVKSTHPDLEDLSEVEELGAFEIRMDASQDWDALRAAADVEGVESIEFANAVGETAHAPEQTASAHGSDALEGPLAEPEVDETPMEEPHGDGGPEELPRSTPAAGQDVVANGPDSKPIEREATHRQPSVSTGTAAAKQPTTKVAETMRVDIDRLDNLMNLTGELVVNRARFVQIAGQFSPALRKASMLNRIRDFSDGLRHTIEGLENDDASVSDRPAQIQKLRAGLELMDEQSEAWENGRHCLGQIGEAIDQLSRVSHGLQRGVLDTRMVPVGPLFSRFKRVVRDVSKDRGKKVELRIRGEKTELDKRMIDELGDPLIHLVRNSIDHGLESPTLRADRGKPEVGTILLEASHSGNNVYIRVQDDGGGIDVDKIRAKLSDNDVLSASEINELTDEQVLEFIWHPGFSTAKEVTDVSGRGVGMDVVKTRINQLNGSIEVDSSPQQGTTFTLRLPLTLAIIDCLLVRMRDAIFSIPIDVVREIVSVGQRDIVTVQGKQTFDVRDEFIPLVSIEDVFHWHDIDYGGQWAEGTATAESSSETVDVVIVQAAGETMGLRVDELLGSQDIVIKSLSDNFINIRGLSGASLMGDGSVCLMLDVGSVIDTATGPSRRSAGKDTAT